jgi:hypothetical protein
VLISVHPWFQKFSVRAELQHEESTAMILNTMLRIMKNVKRMMCGFALVATAFVACAGVAYAQGSRKDDVVFNAQGRPMAGATVRVCTSGATGQPCSPMASIYSDAALTQALANPLSADGLGNYTFYAAPGRYMIEISGPGITTKQLPNVILPSDPSSPTFTTVTTTSGISAFSLSLAGNLTVTGSAAVAGTFTVGGAPVPSTGVDNQWAAPQRFQGPIPYRDATAFGAVSSTQTFTATCTSGSPNITLNAAGDWANGQYISIEGCGATATVPPPDLTPIAITSITRNDALYGFLVVRATVANFGSGAIDYTAGSFVNVTGVTNSAFNGIEVENYPAGGSDTTHLFMYPARVADVTTSSGGFLNPGMAFYEGIHPGSTSYAYTVCSMDAFGGCSAKSDVLTVSNGPANLNELDHNWIYWGNHLPISVDGYCVYMNSNFIGRTWEPAYEDDGTVWARNSNCPATAPSAATHQTLTAKILSGAGTTSLVLDTNAGVSTSGAFTFHDSAPAINAAITAAKADGGGGPQVILPAGNYYVSRVKVQQYKLDVTGQINLTTHPLIVGNDSTIEGHGTSNNIAPTGYNADRARIIAGNNDAFLSPGGAAGLGTVRGFYSISGLGHDVVLAGDPASGPAHFTLENFDGHHDVAGDCMLIDGDTIFTRVFNVNCNAAHTDSGSPTDRCSIYFSNRYHALGADWLEMHFRDMFMNFGAFCLDSPAPVNTTGNTPIMKDNDFVDIEMEGQKTNAIFRVNPGCQGSPLNIKVGGVATTFNTVVSSDQLTPAYGTVYYPGNADTSCSSWGYVFGSNTYIGQGAGIEVGNAAGTTGSGLSVMIAPGTLSSDRNLNVGTTVVGTDTLAGGTVFSEKDSSNGVDSPSFALLMPPPHFIANDGGAGGSCPAGQMRYIRMSAGDGSGNFSKASEEQAQSTGAGGEILQQFYGTILNEGIIAPKYRIYVGTSSGAENIYYETTNTSTFNYDCVSGTNGNHSASVGGTPPDHGTAYYWKIPSRSGDPGWNGLASTDLFGFGKTNPAYSVDSAGSVNADAAFRLGAKLIASATAPTIASGFGTSPTIPNNNGTVAFTVNVGTGGSATSGVITMPAAPTGWNCSVNDITAAAAHVAYNTRQTASTVTSVTVENQTTSTGAAVAWAASDILRMACSPF